MGQARLRGTFEERKAQAIERNERLWNDAKHLEAEIERLRTPAQRAERHRVRMRLVQIYAMAAAFK